MDTAIAAGAIIGLVNGVSLLKEKNYWGFALFLIALIAGVGFGVLGYFGLDVQTGILTALTSSGLYKLAQVTKLNS